ncbi:GNAT family N-acetyltransferase [Zavarzinia sp. CC-PAN008]|uniref:GNAT family N-acetyltransferase n=1 Tax=Zavarzinia sp. CC-PAN008 TaxID=3243332 RepID=UPI003F742AA7
MTAHTIRVLDPAEAMAARPGLEDLLADAVEGGASVNFVWPMTAAKAAAWWDGALASHAKGERVILAAVAPDGGLDGTVQLILAPQENQPHRADLAKLLVHRRARRLGLGRALLDAAEARAQALGRVLLTLDTEADSPAEALYLSAGWTRFGIVPGFALSADGAARRDCSFFFKELAPPTLHPPACPGDP